MAGLRISGLASGMDIDEIVTNLMKAERSPLDKLYQKKTYTEWQRDDYRTMNTALSELDTLIADGIGRQASFIKKTVMVSNEDAISVKNVNSTSDFSGTIMNVTLASAATMISTPEVDSTISTEKKVSEIDANLVGQTITIKAINKEGGFDKKKNPDGTDSTEDKVFSYKITADDTLESIMNKINADSGVTVFFDEGTRKFSMTAKNTGDATKVNTDATITDLPEISLTAVGGTGTVIPTADTFFTKIMKMSANNNATGGSKGANAGLTYNGLTIKRASNTFIINGAEITLKQALTGSVTFSSTPDVDNIYDTIKKFVDSYNGLIANISAKTSEKKNTGYPPLTDDQKKAMSDDEVKKWEDRARKGTLRRDSTLNNLLTKMRTSIYTPVSNTSFSDLAKIGISTTKEYLEGGKLKIDETKLREAIKEDPNGIYNLFMVNVEKTVDGKQVTDLEKSGIARRLRADLGIAMKDISEKAGKTSSVNNTFTLGKLLDNYEDKISAFEERMSALEDRYYKQFTAMEKAISQANSQSASLSSFFTS